MTSASGRARKRKPRPLDLSLPEREEYFAGLARRYKSGESIRDIAESIGRPYGTVRLWLSAAGSQFRSRGGSRQKPIPSTSPISTTSPIPWASSLIDTYGC